MHYLHHHIQLPVSAHDFLFYVPNICEISLNYLSIATSCVKIGSQTCQWYETEKVSKISVFAPWCPFDEFWIFKIIVNYVERNLGPFEFWKPAA